MQQYENVCLKAIAGDDMERLCETLAMLSEANDHAEEIRLLMELGKIEYEN